MKTKVLTIFSLFIFSLAFGQQSTIVLTFTALDGADWLELDEINIKNISNGSDTTLYFPDTVLVLDYIVGINETNPGSGGFGINMVSPNPVIDQTTITLFVPEKDNIRLKVTDVSGCNIVKTEMVLERGTHSFRFIPAERGLFVVTVSLNDVYSSAKILSNVHGMSITPSLEYIGSRDLNPSSKNGLVLSNFIYNPGDELLNVGYVGDLESGMLDVPDTSKNYTFQYAINIPCPDAPIVSYGGQDYNTIQVFGQCWLKENINVGTMILGGEDMTDNGIVEKYCYDDDPANCDMYGGMYNWDEMMQYSTVPGLQGICPSGWHIPTDEDWKVLSGAVDSQYGIGHIMWNNGGFLGLNTGYVLKSASGWLQFGNGSDEFGFTALPGGYAGGISFSFDAMGEWATLWTSTPRLLENKAWNRFLLFYSDQINRSSNGYDGYYYVRCLRDL